jgi:hypothetical protein
VSKNCQLLVPNASTSRVNRCTSCATAAKNVQRWIKTTQNQPHTQAQSKPKDSAISNDLLAKILQNDAAAVDHFFLNSDNSVVYSLKRGVDVFYFHCCEQIPSLPQIGEVSNRKRRRLATDNPAQTRLTNTLLQIMAENNSQRRTAEITVETNINFENRCTELVSRSHVLNKVPVSQTDSDIIRSPIICSFDFSRDHTPELYEKFDDQPQDSFILLRNDNKSALVGCPVCGETLDSNYV